MSDDLVEEWGRVVALADGYAWIETQRRSACFSCAANAACGTGIIGRILGGRRSQIRVQNTLAAKVGDRVALGLSQKAMVRGSMLVYGVPVLLLIIGAAVGSELASLSDRFNRDLVAMVAGTGAFIVGINSMKAYARQLGGGFFEPKMLRVEVAGKGERGISDTVVNAR